MTERAVPREGADDVDVLLARVEDLEAALVKAHQPVDKDSGLKPFQIELLKLQRHLEA